MSSLVIGAGEVGSALAQVVGGHIRDMDPAPGLLKGYDVVHIAFPWGPSFVADVRMYAAHYDADLVVVHSTVPVGTCDPEGWVHSPVRGRHPDLVGGLKTFRKHFGGDRAVEAATAWGRPAETHAVAATTEAGKLWELAVYGVEIAMEKRIHGWCLSQGLDPAEVYGDFTASYNAGWRALGQPGFVKQVIHHEPGPIGGHCVTQNAPLLGVDWVRDMLETHSPEEVDWDA